MQRIRYVLLVLCAALISSLAAGQPSQAVQPDHIGQQGQSLTLLPDGSKLLLGGLDAQSLPVNTAALVSANGLSQPLATGLEFPRAGHTATVLPDGTVFIFGGVGPDGHLVTNAELFDPATRQFSVLADALAVPRAFHTATLLTDGTLLLSGGVMAGGQFPDDVQLWDFRTRKALSHHALLMTPREGHTATLLSGGTVRISGGTDHFGRPVQVDEIYDPISKRFRFSSDAEAAEPILASGIAASIPADGASDVAIQDLIALRFTQLLNVTSVTAQNFVLTGPDESVVKARVTAAESGRLVFVLPEAPLQPGTTYVLRIKNAFDAAGNAVPETSISFQTEGEAPEGTGPDWVPNSTWTDNTGTTKFQGLPPLQAAPNTTALAGQVLKLSGWPLEHVSLEIDGKQTRTDATGRFLLRGLTPGHHVMWIDGATADHANAAYGVYEVGVTILPNKTNVLNYTIWMTRLDMEHAVTVLSPTTAEMVLTNSFMPGLELHLPAGTVITDRNGKTVRQLSITPVPLNKPPFPLPAGVAVPIYFTIQPGGAYVKVLNPGTGPKGARLIYPNAGNLRPGANFEFWNYDADAKGWFIYGLGKVSPDGRSVLPDPGVVIYEFTGAMVGPPSAAPGTGTPDGPPKKRAGDPVDLSTGLFTYTKTDLALPDTVPITFTRTYITNDSRSRAFGLGATDSYDFFMVGNVFPYTYQELIKPDGGRVRFDRVSPGTGFLDAVYLAASSGGGFYGAMLSWSPDSSLPNGGTWKIVMKNGTVLSFPESILSPSPFCQGVIQIKDHYGNVTKIDRSDICLLTKITSPNGRYITVTNDAQSRITQLQDNSGRTVSYAYDDAGRLFTVTDANGGLTTYTYDDQNRMLTIKDARGIVYLTNQYDTFGRVKQQDQADTGTYLFSWTSTLNTQQANFFNEAVDMECRGNPLSRYSEACLEGYRPLVQQVDVTDPRGYVRRVVFGDTGYATSDTHALGQPEQQVETYSYYSDNLLQSVTDTLGRKTTYDYDANANLARVTRMDGTPDAVTTTFTYEPLFNQLVSVTDPLGHTSTMVYDQNGNLTTATDALGHPTTFAYDSAGRISSVSNALNNTVQFGYFGGDPATVTDPLGNVGATFFDAAGRAVSATDAQGHTLKSQYNPLNLVTQVTDALGHNTTFNYDPNGNLLSLTDAATHSTSYTYDNMDRVQMRKDALQRQESYVYDLNGNVVSTTDRKGQVTSFTYDPLNRLKLVGYNTVVNGGTTTYESTVTYTYDAGNRMTQAVDTAGGTITEAYDNLDRLITETTAQGSITYGYDAAGRRTSMTVAGQPQVTYSYDNANRLTQITQGTSTVSFTYDNINRRSTMTLANGVNLAYAYDNDSRLTGITYKFNSNVLGNLTYAYDELGRRTQVGGSFARTGLPGTVTSASYDAANELLNWNGTPISYDLNGNMLSDGTNTFSWNARDEVATLNSVSLQYDAAGRRTRNMAGTSFLYDGANAAQELSGTTVTANLLSGGVDEMFSRTDGSGPFTPLQDAQGSTFALVDANGNLVTQYSYDAFGNTTASGATNANEFQYTGRENEASGLYYYRARYYSPVLGRFISEDPAEDGLNFYAYVGDDPINFSDPLGLAAAPALVPVVRTTLTLVRGGGGVTVSALTWGGFATLLAGAAGLGAEAMVGEAEYDWAVALSNEKSAAEEEWHAVALYNQAMMAHPPLPLAGRKDPPEDDPCEWPDAPEGMDDRLGVDGKRIPDGPTTPGRNKVRWDLGPDFRITYEQHPYHPGAPGHSDPHWHLDTPGNPHQRFRPGDKIPGCK